MKVVSLNLPQVQSIGARAFCHALNIITLDPTRRRYWELGFLLYRDPHNSKPATGAEHWDYALYHAESPHISGPATKRYRRLGIGLFLRPKAVRNQIRGKNANNQN